jgi:hypothetical protein
MDDLLSSVRMVSFLLDMREILACTSVRLTGRPSCTIQWTDFLEDNAKSSI